MLASKSRITIIKCGRIARSHSRCVGQTGPQFREQGILFNYSALTPLTNVRLFGTEKKDSSTTKLDKQRQSHRSVLEEVLIKEDDEPKTTAQKVRKGAENTFLYASVAVSATLLIGLSWLLFDYFFSNGSPQRVYGKALKMIRNDPECQRILGDDIAGFGEQARRSRRHIASQQYKVGDNERCRVTFHVKGSSKAGRAFAEVEKKPGESWDFRFLFIELADRSDTIVLINNRDEAPPSQRF